MMGHRQVEQAALFYEFSLATFASRTILPVSSTMQTLVSLTDTPSPAKCSMLRFSF